MQANGRLMMPVYLHMPAPWWRVPGWEDVPRDVRIMFRERLSDVARVHPWYKQIKEAHIYGSRAFGCATLMSDVDIKIEVKGKLVPLADEAVWDYVHALHLMEHEFGVHIDIWWSDTPTQKGVPYYSFRHDKFFGKKWGERLPLHFRFQDNQWVSAPMKTAVVMGEDPWLP
jgi:hypothetical protein